MARLTISAQMKKQDEQVQRLKVRGRTAAIRTLQTQMTSAIASNDVVRIKKLMKEIDTV